MTLRRIAEIMNLSESFISRVANKRRSFTVEHLLQIASSVGKPLPILILEVTSQEAVPEHLAPLYEKARSVLLAASDLGCALDEWEDSRKGRVNQES